MVADFNDRARTLMQGIVADHPGWERHVLPYGPADDPQADVGSVRFWIPAPREPEHHLEIAQRGNTIDVPDVKYCSPAMQELLSSTPTKTDRR
jgi:hypothetical protein